LNTDTRQLLEGGYDIHVHASPDVIPRALDLAQLCCEAENAGMAGILIKDHCTSTVGRAAALNQMGRGICRFFSALALNPPVGGMNPCAVQASLKAGVDVIYFPTYGAAHHIAIWGAGKPPTAFPFPGQGFSGISILDEHMTLKAEATKILELIAEHGAVLATGHISPHESLILLRKTQQNLQINQYLNYIPATNLLLETDRRYLFSYIPKLLPPELKQQISP